MQFGVGLPHLADERRAEGGRAAAPAAPRMMRVAHGAAHDAAQHVAAALVRGQHAVGDEEARSAQMVGDDAVAGSARAFGGSLAGSFDGGPDERREGCRCHSCCELALQHGGDAFQAHAGVDRRLGQGSALGPGRPASYCMNTRFQISIKRSPSASALPGGPPGIFGAVVVENFRAGAAGAGLAH